MPELPEAETIARGLRGSVTDRTIASLDVLHHDVLRTPAPDLERAVVGRSVASVGRRGKNVVLGLDDGSVIVVNLGMSGRLLRYGTGNDPPGPTHPAVRFVFAEGGTLVFDDVRRFGSVLHLSADAWPAHSASLGPEPLSRGFTSRTLAEGLARSRTPVRSWLLDQRRIAGVGNIYANEALWRARVHPARPANTLAEPEVRRLHRGLRAVLREAVEARGTTLRDYRTVDGEVGGFALRLDVYGREGSACRRCKAEVERVVFGGRSAFFCPTCQT